MCWFCTCGIDSAADKLCSPFGLQKEYWNNIILQNKYVNFFFMYWCPKEILKRKDLPTQNSNKSHKNVILKWWHFAMRKADSYLSYTLP